ncbi:BBE domain-containing protein [Actinomycetospora chibensis]|uniref:BBE domain-containing protein n=1 Tax=Actinomycetospora chibensis TaxID=663606 RepID=A0ABV9RMK6_9PSEU|nr:BBE domain-containing protein [Actinomycetospora chibensis]MDD7922391.1 BBE domain-containing protein [Actinomycetospora chibensis]
MWTDPAQDDTAVDAGVGTAFGRNLERLRQVKTTDDPDNSFRLNNNVLP